MACFTQWWKNVSTAFAVALLAGCAAADSGSLAIRSAHLDAGGNRLRASIDYQPSEAQLAALEHGVPLVLELRITGSESALDPMEVDLVMRYYPLSRRYRLSAAGFGIDSNFALRGYLFDALARLRLSLPRNPCAGSAQCSLDVGLDTGSLPGALRLPALVTPGWQLDDARYLLADDPA